MGLRVTLVRMFFSVLLGALGVEGTLVSAGLSGRLHATVTEPIPRTANALIHNAVLRIVAPCIRRLRFLHLGQHLLRPNTEARRRSVQRISPIGTTNVRYDLADHRTRTTGRGANEQFRPSDRELPDPCHTGRGEVVTPTGRLDSAVASDLRRQLIGLVETGYILMVVDLSAVESVDSSGLGALVAGFEAARDSGGDLKIMSPTEQPALVLELTSVNHVLRTVPSAETAFDRHAFAVLNPS